MVLGTVWVVHHCSSQHVIKLMALWETECALIWKPQGLFCYITYISFLQKAVTQNIVYSFWTGRSQANPSGWWRCTTDFNFELKNRSIVLEFTQGQGHSGSIRGHWGVGAYGLMTMGWLTKVSCFDSKNRPQLTWS